jgi:two-component system chemotaxis response regulator CheB
LSPSHRSNLAPLLARVCRLPVKFAVHGAELHRGHVVVVPPAVHALVTVENRLALISSDGPPPYRPSADLLFMSLALVAGSRSIGVVLSGGGSDGATGATALHEFGGLAMASDEATSEHFGMPAAAIARDDAVDYVLPVAEIAEKLVALLRTDASRPAPRSKSA